jgi:PIN domain nuclease of toxin-antitoxin system
MAEEWKYVLDSSAILAVLQQESGSESVMPVLRSSVITPANQCEVLSILVHRGMPINAASTAFSALGVQIGTFDHTDAVKAAALAVNRNLSLGDRICLGYAEALKLPAITADRHWDDIQLKIKILQIRGPNAVRSL